MGVFSFETEDVTPYSEPQSFAKLNFHDHLLFGYFFKAIVSTILEESQYEVTPYGYESTLPNLKRRLYGSNSTEAATKLRYTPDLVVRNPDDCQVNLVEVKARSASGSSGIRIDEMSYYQRYWAESIVVLVIRSGDHFYAQHVNNLSPQGLYSPDDFLPLEHMFPKVENLKIDDRRNMVRKVLTLFSQRQRCNL